MEETVLGNMYFIYMSEGVPRGAELHSLSTVEMFDFSGIAIKAKCSSTAFAETESTSTKKAGAVKNLTLTFLCSWSGRNCVTQMSVTYLVTQRTFPSCDLVFQCA